MSLQLVYRIFTGLAFLGSAILSAARSGMLTATQLGVAHEPFAWLCASVPGFAEEQWRWIEFGRVVWLFAAPIAACGRSTTKTPRRVELKPPAVCYTGGMTKTLDLPDLLPPRERWIAVWKWTPWKRWMLVGLMCAAGPLYLFSDVPVWYALHQMGVIHHPWVSRTYYGVYELSYQSANRFPYPVLGLRQLQYEWLEANLGPMVEVPVTPEP
jgi:hypothetical protein